jgi:hypothetical protein
MNCMIFLYAKPHVSSSILTLSLVTYFTELFLSGQNKRVLRMVLAQMGSVLARMKILRAVEWNMKGMLFAI